MLYHIAYRSEDMETKDTCLNCKYFYRHYTKAPRSYVATVFGHCCRPRVRIRDIETPACARFSPRKSDT